MATLYWRGDAQETAQVDHFTPANVEIGDVFTITINGKDVSFTATAATVANVVAGLVDAIGQYDSEIAEFAEVSASAGTNSAGATTHLVITGPTDGKPFTATASTTDAGDLDVTVETLTEGSAATNEKQLIDFRGTPTGGTFTLTFDGQTTGAIAYNANAATVELAFEALSTVGAGNGTVSGSAGAWTVEFTGALAGTNVPLVSGNGSSLTGACSLSIETTTEGSATTNLIHRLVLSDGYSVRLQWQSPTVRTSLFTSSITAADLQTEINALTGIGGIGLCVVTKTAVSDLSSYGDQGGFVGRAGSVYDIEFTGGFAGTDPGIFLLTDAIGTNGSGANPQLVYYDGGAIVAEVFEYQAASSTPVDEVQTVTVLGGPTGGTFTLTFSGQTTAGIAYNAANSAVKTALELLSTITTVTVTGNAGGPYTVTFVDPGDQDVAQMTGSAAGLTGSLVDVAVTQSAVAAVNEQQSVTIDANAGGGTFTLTFNAETTGAIAYNASASTVQTALIALATPVAGDITVIGPDGGPYLVTFLQAYAATNVAEMTGDGANLTGGGAQTLTKGSITTPSGPNWWSVAENWSTGAVPVNSDTVIFENNAIDCLYGLDTPSAVTLTNLHLRASYTGRLGLPTHTGTYFEYRETELTLAGCTNLYVGEGEGPGSSRLYINGGAGQSAVIVRGTGTSDNDAPAMQWRGTHASNVVRVYRGNVGIGTEQHTQAATVATLDIGQQGSEDTDAVVIVGPGVTLTTVNKLAGDAEINCAATTVKQFGGSLDLVGSGAYTTLTIQGGQCTYRSSGTVTTLTVGSQGAVDFTEDMRARTVTNTTLEAGAELDDSWGTVTFTNPILLSNCDVEDVTLRLGRNRTLQVA